MTKYRRINLLGGPGVSKTTTAAFLFNQLKKRHFSIELCREHAKLLAYQGKTPDTILQGQLFFKQMEEELTFLNANVDLIVTDSPVILAHSYGRKYGCSSEFKRYFGTFFEAEEKRFLGWYWIER